MATEDLIYLLNGFGIEHGVDLDKLVAAASVISPYLDHPLPGKVIQACTKGELAWGEKILAN
jgi:hydroxymethylglutaryl-CoA lyase